MEFQNLNDLIDGMKKNITGSYKVEYNKFPILTISTNATLKIHDDVIRCELVMMNEISHMFFYIYGICFIQKKYMNIEALEYIVTQCKTIYEKYLFQLRLPYLDLYEGISEITLVSNKDEKSVLTYILNENILRELCSWMDQRF
jgi:hypothetical protein